MGIGHIMLMASQQMLCVRAAGPRSLESVFGNYMVAGAIGQGVGPYVVGWVGGAAAVPPTQLLFIIAAVIAALSFAVALAMRPRPRQAAGRGRRASSCRSARSLRIPGLVAVVLAGVILVSASDIIVIYVPLLGAERNIDVHAIGLLLTVRAASSMVARLFYARMVAAFGRWPLMIVSTFACGLSYAALRRAAAAVGDAHGDRGDGLLVRACHHAQHHHRGRHDQRRRARHRQLAPHHEQPRSASSCCRSAPAWSPRRPGLSSVLLLACIGRRHRWQRPAAMHLEAADG